MLGVGRATEKVLTRFGINIIGQLAAAPDYLLQSHFGKNGIALKRYANGLDCSPVMRCDYVSPVKSIGHGITTLQDLENNAEVWAVMLDLVQDIGTKLRTHKKKAGGVAIYIRNNELFGKEWQCKFGMPTHSPTYNREFEDYICVNEIGDLIKPEYVSSTFGAFLDEHGLRRIRFHDLRHSCASLMLSSGVPMKQIQEWLGHSDFSTTANIYAHLEYSSKISSADAMLSGLGIKAS